MKKIIFKFIYVISLFCMINIPVLANDSDYIIRVGISDNNFSDYLFTESEFYSEAGIDIYLNGEFSSYSAKNVKITAGNDNKRDIYADNKKVIANCAKIISLVPKNNLIEVCGLKRAYKPAIYRGQIDIVPSEKKVNQFARVNVLDLKNYLQGVVPNEMPVAFGLEAVKAQAVAARNYALRPRVAYYKEFDICDSVACQVYFGANTEKPLSNQAVEETDGLVATYDGDLILALYSSTAGGYTENYSNAFKSLVDGSFPAENIPYLVGKPDIPDVKPLNDEISAKEFYLAKPQTYDNESSYFRWIREWGYSELIDMLNKTMLEQASNIKPIFTQNDKFSKIRAINILQRGVSGKVMFLEIVTEKNKYIVERELVIRRLFKKDGKALPSANFVTSIVYDEYPKEQRLRLQGGGYGHGVGMSQYGAGRMSKMGFNFIEILKHYYSNIDIATVPLTLNSISKNSAGQKFYTPVKKAVVVIDENCNVKNMIVVVNGKNIEYDFNNSADNKIKIDISSHIKKGMNTVEYYILDGIEASSLKLHLEIAGDKNG